MVHSDSSQTKKMITRDLRTVKFKDKISHEEIKQILKDEMEKNNSWSNTLREKTSHNS